MRILLFTGKGGVGKTTVAAGTATLAARRGCKTLVLSTDAAHSLGDALAVPLGSEAVEVETGLYALQVQPRERFERSWGEIRRHLVAALDAGGVDAVVAEELTTLPGADEVLALLELRDQVRSGRWDLVVVDCAPTADTLRLLALPEALTWWMRRLFPPERRVVRSLRPVLGRVAGVPPAPDELFAAVERLTAELADVHAVLTDATTTVRIVLTPEAVGVAEARRTLTSLSLHGYRVDEVVANRVLSAGTDDPWRAGWARAHAAQLEDVVASFAPLRVRTAAYAGAEPVGAEALAALAAGLYGEDDPLTGATDVEPLRVERSGDEFVLSLGLPLVDRDDLSLLRHGDELVVTAGGQRRVLALPSALRRCQVAGAALRDGRLRVRFEPDPALWRPL
jgi:arsenite-transporting ATPase